jgi:hypothetical protein
LGSFPINGKKLKTYLSSLKNETSLTSTQWHSRHQLFNPIKSPAAISSIINQLHSKIMSYLTLTISLLINKSFSCFVFVFVF